MGGIYLEKGETNQDVDRSPSGGRGREDPTLPTTSVGDAATAILGARAREAHTF